MTATTTDPFTVPEWEDQELPEMPPGGSPLAPPMTDPEAPWGRKPNGAPYKVDPSRYANRVNNGGRRKAGTPRPPNKRATPGKGGGAGRPDYATAISGLFQLGAAGIAMAGRALKMPALMADAAAVAVHQGPVALALGDMAMDNAAFAAVLDKVAVAGPYAALITALIPMGLQILVNHKGGPVPEEMTATFGVRSRDDLLTFAASATGAPA